jgi:ABC-type dipeptide/oligopeptide/nickel transport system permease subunit
MLYIATAIRTEAGLSFLGLGIPRPTPSWATSSARAARRDLLDPRLKGE